MVQTDIGGLVAQFKDLEKKNVELEAQNRTLISKVVLLSVLLGFISCIIFEVLEAFG